MPVARIPLTHPIESRQPTTVRDSRSVNCLFEKRTEGEISIVKRPGLALLTCVPAIPTGTGQGLTSWYNYLVAINSNIVYGISGGTSITMGTVVGATNPFSFTQTAFDQYLVFHNGANLYSINKNALTVSQPISGTAIGDIDIVNGGNGYALIASVTSFTIGTSTVNKVAHGLVVGQGVKFSTTSALPGGMSPDLTYRVNTVPTADTFTLSTVANPPVAITMSGVATGTWTYLASPTVTFTGGGYSTIAKATATVYAGSVSAITVTDAGIGYSSIPTITLSAPNGTFNAATGTLNLTSTSTNDTFANWTVSSVTITSGGGPYAVAPVVTMAFGTIGVANLVVSGYAVLTNNIVTSVVITNSPVTGGYVSGNGNTTSISFAGAPAVTATATVAMNSTIAGPFAYGIEYLDGYVFIMTTSGKVYASNLEDPTVWNAGNYVSTESDPDDAVALVRHLNYLVAFGQWSTDFFYNAGNASGSPLSVNKTAKLELGCAIGGSVAKAEQTLMWVGNSKTQGRSIYMMQGLVPEKISIRYIDKYLNRDNLSSCYSYVMKMSGHTCYVLTLPNSDITFVYDLDEQAWYQWTSQSSGTETYFKFLYFSGHVEYVPNLYLQHETDGKVYIMNADYYKDDTNDIYFRSVSKNLDSGSGKRKFFTKIEVIGDKVAGNLSIRHSDNDYIDWSTYRVVDLSKPRPILYQGGSARRRAYEVFSSDNIPIRLEALELSFDIGEQGRGQEG